jgi:two-component system sensor kinase FixL
MSDGIRRTPTCLDGQESSTLERENHLLRQENDKLKRQAEEVAEANARAAELMVRLEEANESLHAEVQRRQQVEEELRRASSGMEAQVQTRTTELREANEHLAREVEERGQVDHTLRESGRRLHTILDNILTGVLIVEARTHQIVDVNPHAAEIIGLPRDQILGHVCHNFVCLAEKGRCPVSDLSQTVDRSERLLLRADGTKVPILKTVVSSTWEGCEYLIESFVDISRLKQVEGEVRESLSLLEATLEATPDGILVVDLSGKIKSFNRQFQRIWSLPDATLRTHNTEEAAAQGMRLTKDPEAFQAMRKRSGAHPEVESCDVLELKDGRIVERYSRPQILGDRVIGQVLSFRDVTERHLAEQRQAALLRKVAEINEELSHFAYVVSHDLKAPLRGIKLIAEWLCEDYADKLDAEAKEQMALLQNRVNRMHNLIDGVLQYSRVGRIKEDRVDVDLNELLPIIVDTIAPPEHIQITADPGLPILKGEKTQIIQVFQNLLTNAVKFMDKPKGQIRIGCTEEGEFWRFRVADNGPGIEEKYFERIFRIFQTLAPKDAYESTGVGLTLVKKIVEMYGGRVWVESQVGQGSTFFFTFPQRHVEVQDGYAGHPDRSGDSVADGSRAGGSQETQDLHRQ